MKLILVNYLKKYIIKNKSELYFYIVQQNYISKTNTYGFIKSDPFICCDKFGSWAQFFFNFLEKNILFSYTVYLAPYLIY